VRTILLAGSLALVASLIGTPAVIRFFRGAGYGQAIREDGPSSHFIKRGTPTMGGTAIILSAVIAYFVATLVQGEPPSAGGLLAMGVFVGMGVVGFVDDYIKLRHNRSLGLNKTAKLTGQAIISIVFAIGAEYVADTSTRLSFIGATGIDFGVATWAVTFGSTAVGPLFVVAIFLILSLTSNAVNLTDGLDGLAAGTSSLIFGAYVVIAFWQFRNQDFYPPEVYIHADALAVAAAATMGATLGFLWWNAPPAKIFMGDTGSLALGGMLAAMAVLTETELLLIILGGLYIVEIMSVVAQVASFRIFHQRIFKMAPLHHHFELVGWQETTIIVRFWIVAGLAVAFGLGLFYNDFLAGGGIG
jgi:phospho-N-acetylmuramoyl-pentapeptide-transferase